MPLLLARAIVAARGIYFLLTGRQAHRSGLTVPCAGCPDPDPHDAHLGIGALTVLGSSRADH
jgi:hypothetical protein